MSDIVLAQADYFRGVAKEARIRTKNRYFESNPVLTPKQVAMLARMGMRRFRNIGDGPIRAAFCQPGSFDDAAFIVSGQALYRLDQDGEDTFIGVLSNPNLRTFVSMAATSNIGEAPANLFIADGATLYLYIDDGYATGSLSGTPDDGDTIRIGDVYYQWTDGDVNAGTPDGTSGDPWLVARVIAIDGLQSFVNMKDAINLAGIAGTTYTDNLSNFNPDAEASYASASGLLVRARQLGAAGNTVVTTETGTGVTWADATLTDGGSPSLTPVQTPDDVGVISLGYIASHVVVVPAQGQGVNGRFYWIEPGQIIVDPLNFATAERSPDPVYEVIIFGDQFWLPGQTTTEVWYFTGSPDAPVLRLQGVTFDRGVWAGTALKVKDSMVIVDSDGGVFQIAGGIDRISTPDVEERIRESIQRQQASLLT